MSANVPLFIAFPPRMRLPATPAQNSAAAGPEGIDGGAISFATVVDGKDDRTSSTLSSMSALVSLGAEGFEGTFGAKFFFSDSGFRGSSSSNCSTPLMEDWLFCWASTTFHERITIFSYSVNAVVVMAVMHIEGVQNNRARQVSMLKFSS